MQKKVEKRERKWAAMAPSIMYLGIGGREGPRWSARIGGARRVAGRFTVPPREKISIRTRTRAEPGRRGRGRERERERVKRGGGGGGGGEKKVGRERNERNAPKRWLDLVSRPENERFDEALVLVQGGRGGRGEVWKKRGGGGYEEKRGRLVKNFKYKPGGSGGAKTIFLQADSPSDGTDGGHVYVEADERCDDMLHLHERYHYKGKDGSNANPTSASKTSAKNGGRGVSRRAKPLILKVPVGTSVIVKSKARGGKGKKEGGGGGGSIELMRSGQRVLVASGGKGGLGVVEPHGSNNRNGGGGGGVDRISASANRLDWQKESLGREGETLGVQLVLRVKADVGLVGLPNAGKSTLLSAITKAKPEIADYPFTTLVPNLGVIGGSPVNTATSKGEREEEGWNSDGEFDFSEGQVDLASFHCEEEEEYSYEENPLESVVVADLPGLIGDAHKGKGLGRVFLRHLKRTRLICHLVDIASSSDPFSDYIQIREELRMYNPDYVLRKPHVVVFTKCDLLDESLEGGDDNNNDESDGGGGRMKEPKTLAESLMEKEEFLSQVAEYQSQYFEAFADEGQDRQSFLDLLCPSDVVYISSKTGQGMDELIVALSNVLQSLDF